MTNEEFFTSVAESIANVEKIIEDIPDPQGMSASTLRLVVGELSLSFRLDHPRFNSGRFEKQCMPIASARQAEIIRRTVLGK